MKKKNLVSLVTTLLLTTALISHYALAGSNTSSVDPNVVALNNARSSNCWLHSVSEKDYCINLQSELGCSPCDNAEVSDVPPPLPEPPEPIIPSNN